MLEGVSDENLRHCSGVDTMMGQGWGRPAKARLRFKVKVASSRVGVESSSKLMSQRDVPPAGPLTCAFFSGSGKGKVTGTT